MAHIYCCEEREYSYRIVVFRCFVEGDRALPRFIKEPVFIDGKNRSQKCNKNNLPFGFVQKNSYVIPNPVASIFTDPNAVDTSIERRIAAVGRYSKIKNFDTYFALHSELQKRKWRHTASFVTNPDADLKKMPKTIELLPSMTTEGLKKFYLSQGLIVCPSTFETFGNVPMEAACLGIPVLVSDKMGCAEVLKKVGLANMVISFDDIGKVT